MKTTIHSENAELSSIYNLTLSGMHHLLDIQSDLPGEAEDKWPEAKLATVQAAICNAYLCREFVTVLSEEHILKRAFNPAALVFMAGIRAVQEDFANMVVTDGLYGRIHPTREELWYLREEIERRIGVESTGLQHQPVCQI